MPEQGLLVLSTTSTTSSPETQLPEQQMPSADSGRRFHMRGVAASVAVAVLVGIGVVQTGPIATSASAAPITASATTSSRATVSAPMVTRSAVSVATRSFRRAVATIPYRFASKKFNLRYAEIYIKAKYGWSHRQFLALKKMWSKESAWNEKAHNSNGGAHGIPQAQPGRKMAKYGKDWRKNPTVQIKWGAHYIKSVYKTPTRAWAFWLRHHWY